MDTKIIKAALVGKTNAGKSTLINTLIGEQISIINKKINTTQDLILGIKNITNTQIIFFDTPGSNFLKTTNISQKKLKINLWQAIDNVDVIIYLVDSLKFSFKEIQKDVLKISEVKKSVILVFNKVDLLDNKVILPYINELKQLKQIEEFFLISAKNGNGIDDFLNYLVKISKLNTWIYKDDEITDKDDIYITNECTRNAILEYIHQEIPYNVKVTNGSYVFLKNNDLKIKQLIEISNDRYKGIILGKNGVTIKKIREKSQSEIIKILNCKVHLYLKIICLDEK
jgi:GTP-binding protein Era